MKITYLKINLNEQEPVGIKFNLSKMLAIMDFQKEVIDKSFEIPVVVDFWAPWCGPCKILGPVIEEVANEQEGQWELVKVNTEEHEDIAARYRIMSIPNVKMFYRGEVYHEFTGALPKASVLEWLSKVLPDEGLRALDKLLFEKANPDTEDLETLHTRYPESQEIAFVLAQVILWENPQRTVALLKNIKMGSPFYDKANSLRDITSLLLLETSDERLNSIIRSLQKSDFSTAVPEMIELINADRNYADGILTKATIGLFNSLGPQHDITREYRKKLDMALWH